MVGEALASADGVFEFVELSGMAVGTPVGVPVGAGVVDGTLLPQKGPFIINSQAVAQGLLLAPALEMKRTMPPSSSVMPVTMIFMVP